MPYIGPDRREALEECRVDTVGRGLSSPGELNFVLTTIVDQYLRRQTFGYAALNEVIGVLECAKLEFYRRMAVPYEDAMRDVNGDVYS